MNNININHIFESPFYGADKQLVTHAPDVKSGDSLSSIKSIDDKIKALDDGIINASLKLFNGSSVDALDVQKGVVDRRSFLAVISSVSQTLRSSADRLTQSVG